MIQDLEKETFTITEEIPKIEHNGAQLFQINVKNNNHYVPPIKRIKIWDKDGKLVYDFIPVKRNSDGKVGVFDVVNSIFHQSPEEFIASEHKP